MIPWLEAWFEYVWRISKRQGIVGCFLCAWRFATGDGGAKVVLFWRWSSTLATRRFVTVLVQISSRERSPVCAMSGRDNVVLFDAVPCSLFRFPVFHLWHHQHSSSDGELA